jgi:hypothetical protein
MIGELSIRHSINFNQCAGQEKKTQIKNQLSISRLNLLHKF